MGGFMLGVNQERAPEVEVDLAEKPTFLAPLRQRERGIGIRNFGKCRLQFLQILLPNSTGAFDLDDFLQRIVFDARFLGQPKPARIMAQNHPFERFAPCEGNRVLRGILTKESAKKGDDQKTHGLA